MANTKSAIKNIRKSIRRAEQNRSVKSRLRTLGKRVKSAVDEKKAPEEIRTAAIEYVSALDKACKSNAIHKNLADRKKSSCAKYIFTS